MTKNRFNGDVSCAKQLLFRCGHRENKYGVFECRDVGLKQLSAIDFLRKNGEKVLIDHTKGGK